VCDLVYCFNYFSDHKEASMRLKNWGLTFRPVPVKVQGPVYKRETILLGNNLRKQIGVNMDWGMDVARNAMFKSVSTFYF